MNSCPRRAILNQWIKAHGMDSVSFRTKTGFSKAYISTVMNGEKPIRERAARKLEVRAGMPYKHLEGRLAENELSAEHRSLVAAYDELLPEQQSDILREMLATAEGNRKNFQQLLRKFGGSDPQPEASAPEVASFKAHKERKKRLSSPTPPPHKAQHRQK